jgi:hypothetical protein
MLKDVEFQEQRYDPAVVRILALADDGKRPMPLIRAASGDPEARKAIGLLNSAPSVKAGLYLYFSCWDEGHITADSVDNPDGYFWHAIAHRQEPDAANSSWWFRKTGAHPVFPKLAAGAAERGYNTGASWDPYAFIQFCEKAAGQPGSANHQTALEVQLIEWHLLFDHCVRSRRD